MVTYYAVERGIAGIGTDAKLRAMIPYVDRSVGREEWRVATTLRLIFASTARRAPAMSMPIYNDKEISIYGSGLAYGCTNAPKKGDFQIQHQRHDAVLVRLRQTAKRRTWGPVL